MYPEACSAIAYADDLALIIRAEQCYVTYGKGK